MIIPIVFLISNVLLINGLYPTFVIDHPSSTYNIQLRDIVEQPNQMHIGPLQASKYIPQIYILFFITQMGVIFFIFQIRGITVIILQLKNNPQYSLLAILIILVLLVWSYLLVPDLGDPSSKYLLYLLPLFSVITVMGMNLNTQRPFYQLYYYCIIIFSTFFFLNYSISASSYDNALSDNAIFAGFEINNLRIDVAELLVSFYIILPILIYKIKYRKQTDSKKSSFQKYVPLMVFLIFVIEVSILYNSNIMISSIEERETTAPPEWGNHAIEVINYLNEESGNRGIVSISTPSISFFTNRTNFDISYPATFYSILDFLSANNSAQIEQWMASREIGYVVIPKERNIELYNNTQNILKNFNIIELVQTNPNFVRTELPHFDIYKYDGPLN